MPESKIWPWPLGRERQLRVHDCRRQRRRLYLRRHLITVLRPKLWNVFVLTGSGIIYVWKFHLTAGLQFEWFRFSSISYYVQRTTYFIFCKNSIHSNWIPVVQLYFPLQSECFLVIVTALKCRDVGEYWAAELKKFQNLDAAHSQLNMAWVKGYPQSYSVFKIISLFASKHFYSKMLSYFLTLGTWIGCDQVKHMIAWSLRSNLKKLKANSDELKSRADSWKDYCIVSVENSNFYIFLWCNHPPHVAAAKALHLNVH